MTAPRSERRRLASMVSVRFTPDEEASVRAAAERTGESVSNYIRQAALGCAPSGARASLSWPRRAASSGPLRLGTSSSALVVTFVARAV